MINSKTARDKRNASVECLLQILVVLLTGQSGVRRFLTPYGCQMAKQEKHGPIFDAENLKTVLDERRVSTNHL
jgi:hypothetical protein